MKFGDKIRFLRRKANMNQTELAEKLGVGTSTIGSWETNIRKPDFNYIIKLSEIFNVSIDYLLNSHNDNSIVILGREGTFKNITVTDEQIKIIEDFIDTLKSEDENKK